MQAYIELRNGTPELFYKRGFYLFKNKRGGTAGTSSECTRPRAELLCPETGAFIFIQRVFIHPLNKNKLWQMSQIF